jgi:hypothetical protein
MLQCTVTAAVRPTQAHERTGQVRNSTYPYFYPDDRFAGRILLLAALFEIELATIGIDVDQSIKKQRIRRPGAGARPGRFAGNSNFTMLSVAACSVP